jgi:hypothetical protein
LRGELLDAGINAIAIFPYLGHLAKLGKLGKYPKQLARAIKLALKSEKAAALLKPVLKRLDDLIKGVPQGLMKKLPDGLREPLERLKNQLDNFFRKADVPAGAGGRPKLGAELGRGSEGVIYENLDQPGWVVKEFHQGSTSPLQARNEFENLEKARSIHPDNVVNAQPPAGARQGFIVKEKVTESPTPPDFSQKAKLNRDFENVNDAGGNMVWGTTPGNSTPRWILIE